MICVSFLRFQFSGTVGPWVLYDNYLMYEEKVKEQEESQKKAAEADEIEIVVQEKKNIFEENINEDEIDCKLLVSAKIIERMLNLNTFDDISKDFRYFEDPVDEMKSVDGNFEGSLLPLWKFVFEDSKNLEVTGLQWNPKYADLFAIGYGSYNFYEQPMVGYLCLYSLKNPSYPEYIRKTHCGIMCLDIHDKYPQMVVVGLYDGNIAVFNLKSNSCSPNYISSAENGKHCEPVYSVKWAKDNLDGYLNFYSCSGDGRVTNWTLVKQTLWYADTCMLNFLKPLTNSEEVLPTLANGARSIAFMPTKDTLFIVGTEEGDLFMCTTEYSSKFLMSYHGHVTPVNKILWNTFYTPLFISCASEYAIHIWHRDFPTPLLSYSIGSTVGDVAWAPYSSTVFAVVTSEGTVVLYDISIDKYSPVCKQVLLFIFTLL